MAQSMLPGSTSRTIVAFACLLAWLVAVAALIVFCPQYIPDGRRLLVSDFEAQPSAARPGPGPGAHPLPPWRRVTRTVVWQAWGGFENSACVSLTAAGSASAWMEWGLDNPRRYAFLAFRGKMRSQGVVPGPRPWNTARFLVYFSDNTGRRRWDWPHVAGQVTGTSAWRDYAKVFRVPEFAVSAHVAVQHNGRAGTVWCDDIILRPVIANPTYIVCKKTLFASGAVLGVGMVLLLGLWKKGSRLLLAATAAVLAGVLCSSRLLETIADGLRLPVAMLKHGGHLSMFLVLGLLSMRRVFACGSQANSVLSRLTRGAVIVTGLLLFAALTEFLQFATFDRSPTIGDLLLDTAGIAVGAGLACALASRHRR